MGLLGEGNIVGEGGKGDIEGAGLLGEKNKGNCKGGENKISEDSYHMNDAFQTFLLHTKVRACMCMLPP